MRLTLVAGPAHLSDNAHYVNKKRIDDSIDTFITPLRETHHRRPRLQQEFDRANLP